jgi:cell wall-associated NlpC family hydrolase
VLSTADRYLGVRYRYGGTTPERGFDCSGFVQHVFAEQGVSLPRTSRQQALAGRGVVPLLNELTAGDLVLFAQNGTRIDHVAIYAGRGRIIHSTSSGGGVRYDDLSTPRGKWFVEHMVAARRILVGRGAPVEPSVTAQLAPDSLDPPDRAPGPVP